MLNPAGGRPGLLGLPLDRPGRPLPRPAGHRPTDGPDGRGRTATGAGRFRRGKIGRRLPSPAVAASLRQTALRRKAKLAELGAIPLVDPRLLRWGELAGDVLVTPDTNPAWTPLFRRAAAVVVEMGGSASHAAIVAREYGLPAVMGVQDATRRLADGCRVRVDGSRGLVLRAD